MRNLKTYLAIDRRSDLPLTTIDRVTNSTAARRAAEAAYGVARGARQWAPTKVRYWYDRLGTERMAILTEVYDAWLVHEESTTAPPVWDGWDAFDALDAFETDPVRTKTFIARALLVAGTGCAYEGVEAGLQDRWQIPREEGVPLQAPLALHIQPEDAYRRIRTCLRRGEVPSAELDALRVRHLALRGGGTIHLTSPPQYPYDGTRTATILPYLVERMRKDEVDPGSIPLSLV